MAASTIGGDIGAEIGATHDFLRLIETKIESMTKGHICLSFNLARKAATVPAMKPQPGQLITC